MLYIILNGQKEYLSKEITEKYNLKPGMLTPFTGYEVLADSENEEKIISGDQKIYPTPENADSQISQG